VFFKTIKRERILHYILSGIMHQRIYNYRLITTSKFKLLKIKLFFKKKSNIQRYIHIHGQQQNIHIIENFVE